jgi:hypothetical protein
VLNHLIEEQLSEELTNKKNKAGNGLRCRIFSSFFSVENEVVLKTFLPIFTESTAPRLETASRADVAFCFIP